MVPVFVGDVHLFTAVAKAHQADIGNSMPTTYFAMAKDVYEEGALNFPCVQVQRDREDISDVIEMCRRRIRVPDQCTATTSRRWVRHGPVNAGSRSSSTPTGSGSSGSSSPSGSTTPNAA